MTRYWIAVASYEHVKCGVTGGFAQVCHGRPGPLKMMSEGDWIIYYSPTIHYGGHDTCQSFTAIGRICRDAPYAFAMSENFTPWRRNVNFLPSQNTDIKLLLDRLNFIKNKKKWGFPFRRGCFEVSQEDFELIAKAMEIT